MIPAFIYQQSSTRVRFGRGAINQLRSELSRLGALRAIVVSTPSGSRYADEALRSLGPIGAGRFVDAAPHVPVETARRANDFAEDAGADAVVSIGGGSAIGLAKCIGLWSHLPIVAIPTTYSGSEATPIYGFTEEGLKKVGHDPQVRPRVVLYDPTLVASLPESVAATSGMNAMAHCVVGLWANDAHPISNLFAAEGIRALSRSLPRIVANPDDLSARTESFYGSWLAGSMLANVSPSMHYQICHVLGGSFNLDHAEVHAVMLPQSVAFNREAAPDAIRRAADALGADDPARAIFDLEVALGAPTALRDIGMKERDLDRAAQLALHQPVFNPAAVDSGSISIWLENAFVGRRP